MPHHGRPRLLHIVSSHTRSTHLASQVHLSAPRQIHSKYSPIVRDGQLPCLTDTHDTQHTPHASIARRPKSIHLIKEKLPWRSWAFWLPCVMHLARPIFSFQQVFLNSSSNRGFKTGLHVRGCYWTSNRPDMLDLRSGVLILNHTLFLTPTALVSPVPEG